MGTIYDVVIIGGGPAGLAGALYSGRAKLETLMIEKAREGGQIVNTSEIVNYPGAEEHESGFSLVEKMKGQAARFGAKTVYDTVNSVDLEAPIKVINCGMGSYQARAVIIATGAAPIGVGCPGEKEFTGKGVSYCATCDADFFEGLHVYVVGGGDTAVEEAIYLTKFARNVTIIHRRNALRAAKSIREKAFANNKIDFMWDSVVKELGGTGMLSKMVVENVNTGEQREIAANEADGVFGLFVFIGFKPESHLFEGKLRMENGYIVTDEDMRTSIDGVFAAGDVCRKNLRQVVTAVADGAIAAVTAEKYLEGKP